MPETKKQLLDDDDSNKDSGASNEATQTKKKKPAPTTRLIVKNLPKYITEARLREHFAVKGTITDVRIMRTKDGRSRQFGFVGYSTLEAAKEAKKYFNNTFIDTRRVTVEYSLPSGDSGLARPWSKYSKGSSAYERLNKAKEGVDARKQKQNKKGGENNQNETTSAHNSKEEEDPKLKEFLQQTTNKRLGVWANDDVFVDTTEPDQQNPKKRKKGPVVIKEKVPNKKPGGEGLVLERTHVVFDDDGSSDDELYEELPAKRPKLSEDVDTADEEGSTEETGSAENMMDIVEEQPSIPQKESHLDYFKSKMRTAEEIEKLIEAEENNLPAPESEQKSATEEHHSSESTSEKSSAEKNSVSAEESSASAEKNSASAEKNSASAEKNSASAQKNSASAEKVSSNESTKVPNLEDLSESGRIFVRNLPYTATEDDLYQLFSKYGTLSEVHISVDKETKTSKGFGFVLFMVPSDALKAYNALNGSIFQGRLLHLLPAAMPPPKPEPKTSKDEFFRTQFQKRKEEKMREMAGQDFNWNSLFVRTDTVASALANQLNVDKSQIFDRESNSSIAVRLALGEANIVAETKKFLVKEGVVLEALEGHYKKDVQRSDTVMLVKNLPFSTQVSELNSLFSQHGTVSRVVLTPSRALAIVEFVTPSDAKAAFKALAYKQFKDAPLLLEWAPVGVLRPVDKKEKQSEEAEESEDGDAHITDSAEEKLLDEDTTVPSTTVYVKNLNFATTDEALKNFFADAVGKQYIRAAVIPKRERMGAKLSSGFGFVEFTDPVVAANAIKKLQGKMLDGHALQLKLSKQKKVEDKSKKRKEADNVKPSTKLLVRNVPFEATKKEIFDLFSPFGEIKSVRLPRKQGGKQHRGFAFVTFLTKEDAKNAKESLNTHLYGRHLVIDYANDDTSPL